MVDNNSNEKDKDSKSVKKDKSIAKSSDKDNKKSENNDYIEDAEEILENMPPEVKKSIEMAFSMQRVSAIPNPLHQKLNEKHIDKILDQNQQEETHQFEKDKISQRYNLIYFVLVLCVIIFLVVFLAELKEELLKEIFTIGGTLAGGFGAGYGYKSFRDRKKDFF